MGYLYLYLYICMSKCICLCESVVQGPPGKWRLAEGGYPVEIKVNNNNNKNGFIE